MFLIFFMFRKNKIKSEMKKEIEKYKNIKQWAKGV